jgi:hypothetical protein
MGYCVHSDEPFGNPGIAESIIFPKSTLLHGIGYYSY